MVDFKLRSPEELEEIPVQVILDFMKKNWWLIYPILQGGYELIVKAYQRWKKKHDAKKVSAK